jgi:hypothetical protein
MKNKDFFLKRALDSIEKQTFKDYEVVITEDGMMAENTNSAIKQAKGEIIKILYMDDYFAHPDALANMMNGFEGGWLATGCAHDNGQELYNVHYPEWNSPEEMMKGANTIGSPSVVMFENDDPLLFDENLSWLLDCELYTRLFARYGKPTILNDIGIIMGIHDGQMTNILTDEEKLSEHKYLEDK